MASTKNTVLQLPVLALRGMMVFPHMTIHFDVGRDKSVTALQKSVEEKSLVFLTGQKDSIVEDPQLEDLYQVGAIARIKQVSPLPGGNLRVMVEGMQRGILLEMEDCGEYLEGQVRPVTDESTASKEELEALQRTISDYFAEYCKQSMRVSQETMRSVLEVKNPGDMADVIASSVLNRVEDRQTILEKLDPAERLETLCAILLRETELAATEKRVQIRIKEQVEQNQKDYYLREQIKAIQRELGDNEAGEADELREKLEKLPLNEEAKEKSNRELNHLRSMAPGTPEIQVSRTWLEWISDLPWGVYTEDSLDLQNARKVLDSDHFGLDKLKERIIEYLAVLQVKQNMRGPILCFAGPPGVGKTSIVKAIAQATGRKFVQMSLGGVRDEAEIRGHRRTYIGAIPGRIISGIKQAGSMNPVFLFDEIDKMSSDVHGDPASAMLEVLDAEQNHSFRDHYLDIPFDLSKVMFVTTANNIENIPAPLQDRMEIIEVPSYTEKEKLAIAQKHLLPKQIKEHGLKAHSVRLGEPVMKKLIESFTREAGVRELERTIGSVVRKSTVEMLDTQKKSITVTEKKLTEYLGAAKYLREAPGKEPMVGVVNGLAYTSVGGELLQVECSVMEGTGALQLTGKLGDVMQESAKAALSWVRAHSAEWGFKAEFFKQHDIHIHLPEGAVPKDGPSAGVTLITALVSALCNIPVRQDVAMTGEISLIGRVLPIGGLREKLMAAYRGDMNTVLVPRENAKDLEEIDPEVREKLKFVLLTNAMEVLENALCYMPKQVNTDAGTLLSAVTAAQPGQVTYQSV